MPPPPNSCEITSWGDGVGLGDGVGVAVGSVVAEGIGVAVGEGDGEGIGVAVGVELGEGVGRGVEVGVGVGVGVGVTRMKREPSSFVPGLKLRLSLPGAVECREKVPLMSGVRVSDWFKSPRRPSDEP